jgi:hypothetical protein
MWTPVQFSKRIQHAVIEDVANKMWYVELYIPIGNVKCESSASLAGAIDKAEEYVKQHHPGYVL